ncbi:MAG: hypothetical protein RJR35_05445 [Thermoanaerobacterales bacterium]|nr:hypothetical protein [Thermoanaerobacterales bacterium]
MPFVIAFPYERLEDASRKDTLKRSSSSTEFLREPSTTICALLSKTARGKHVASEQKDFVQLKAHYAFKSIFCNPGQANEKGLVENLVSWIRRNMFVPDAEGQLL